MDSSKSGSPSSSGMKIVTRKYLYDLIQEQNLSTLEEKLDFLENHLLSSYGDSNENKISLKKKIAYFKTTMRQKWSKAQRKEDIFLKSNSSWLNGTFEIPNKVQFRPGRPSKSFEELSERSKRRKTEEVRSTIDDKVIVHAARSSLRAKGLRDASQLLKEIVKSPTRAGKYKKAYLRSTLQNINKLTPHEALAMFVKADMTRQQYQVVRETNKSLYPCYDLLLKAKEELYPPKQDLRITSMSAECTLQGLVDITIKRLSMYIEDVLITLNEEERKQLTLICKWGCDGSQQAKYKQTIENPNDTDANIFISSFVPLQIFCGKEKKKIVWQNPTASSTRFCRPIRFRFIKETSEVTNEEIEYVNHSAENLVPTELEIDGKKFSFVHIFKMTMIDGKICNAAMEVKSTSRCYVCLASSKDFNKLEKKNAVSPKALEFGLSVLHARIRIFESILHLAYKLPIQKYRTKKSEDEKLLEKNTKKKIQERFKNETGLLIDMPKANYGNTNDGNTSRRFFQNPRLASHITGVDYDLIYRLNVILEALSSGYNIDTEKYDQYALETAKLYVKLYNWHPITPTMHKILIHGAVIIKKSLLPIGQLSEEAQEARNKHFRAFRESHARKFSREACNRDIYNRLLLSSDPYISSTILSKRKKPKTKEFCPETLELLLPLEEDSDTPEPSDTEE